MENKKTILLVDDDQILREQLARAFLKKDFLTFQAASANDAIELVDLHKFSHALVDLRMAPGVNGLKVIEVLAKAQPWVKSVVFTGFGSIGTAVEAIRKGAVNYLTKPASINEIMSAFEGQNKNEHRIPSLEEISEQYVNRVLDEFNGNISKSAKALGLHRRSLQRKLGRG